MKNIYFFTSTFIFLFLCYNFLLHAQEPKENWVLDTPQSGTKEYIASESISLQAGFSYSSSSGNTFTAKVDQTLVFSPANNTYVPNLATIDEAKAVGEIPFTTEVAPC